MPDKRGPGRPERDRRHPHGDAFLAAFAPPRELVRFDDLAEVAAARGCSLADAMIWLATAQAGEVIQEAGSPGNRSYRLTERGRAILANDPRAQGRREPAMA